MNEHESYVSLETAELLKQAGFDWELIDVYIGSDIYTNPAVNWKPRNWNSHGFTTGDQEDREWCSAPTLSVAQRWLREVKGYYISMMNLPGACDWCIDVNYKNISYYVGEIENYEEALEAGIKKCLTLILEKDE